MLPINFNDIDEKLVELIKLLNYDIGFATKYSCSGHKERDQLYIMFHENVDFNKLSSFLEELVLNARHSHFGVKYWVRSLNKRNKSEIKKNWMIETHGFKSEEIRDEIINEIIVFINAYLSRKEGLNV